ncbi:MAG: hypothetical protein K2M91_12955, partial [Lachnospiraceae bacterium]|nr:hypothetical protein [Lachnospiraceae bacterium]
VMNEDMSIGFQSVLLGADNMEASIENARKEDEKQYAAWGIIREGDNFYYQGQLVHLFYDKYDAETVIRTININPLGTVDVKVTRSIRNKIMSVEYMTQEEVEELFGMDDFSGLDCDIEEEEFEVWEKEFEKESDVYRLTVEELPDDVINMMRNCDIRTWHVLHFGGRQYIRYQGFAWNYAYQPIYDESGWRIDIKRLGKRDYGYVLLSLPDNGPVKVYCDGQEVELMEIGK